jgi:hypothetical protein
MNADTFAMQKGDGSGSAWTDVLYFNAETGEYVFDGKLSADLITALEAEFDVTISNTVIVNNLYAEYGRIANLTVSELNTGWKKITNYLASDTSDVNYIREYDQYALWITASTDGSETQQEEDYDGNPLYWLDDTYTGMTTTANSYPVLTYVYTELTKMDMSFQLIGSDYEPMILVGHGTGTANNAKGVFWKSADNVFHMGYFHGVTGDLIEIQASNDGLIKSGGAGDTQLRNIKYVDATPVVADIDDLDDGDIVIGGYSQYDRLGITASATITEASAEYIEMTGTTSGQTLTITPPASTAGAVLKIIKNRSNQTWTIGATVDGTASPTMVANAAITILWNGTDWSKVAAFTP